MQFTTDTTLHSAQLKSKLNDKVKRDCHAVTNLDTIEYTPEGCTTLYLDCRTLGNGTRLAKWAPVLTPYTSYTIVNLTNDNFLMSIVCSLGSVKLLVEGQSELEFTYSPIRQIFIRRYGAGRLIFTQKFCKE